MQRIQKLRKRSWKKRGTAPQLSPFAFSLSKFFHSLFHQLFSFAGHLLGFILMEKVFFQKHWELRNYFKESTGCSGTKCWNFPISNCLVTYFPWQVKLKHTYLSTVCKVSFSWKIRQHKFQARREGVWWVRLHPPLHPQAPEVHFLVNQRLILNKVNQ